MVGAHVWGIFKHKTRLQCACPGDPYNWVCPIWAHRSYTTDMKQPFLQLKRGICHGGHLAITYVVIVPQIFLLSYCYSRLFLLISPPSNFIMRVLPFSHELKSHIHLGYNLCRLHQMVIPWVSYQIRRYNNSPSVRDRQNSCHTHSITQWSKRDPASSF